MSMYAIAKLCAILILASPFALILVAAIITYIPGAPELLFNFFMSTLGEVPIFDLASNVVQVFLENKSVTFETFLFDAMGVLLRSLMDAMIMSCCIFAVKVLGTSFKSNGQGRFVIPKWGLAILGVLLGVVAIKLKQNALPLVQSLVYPLGCIAVILYGIGLMFRVPSGKYRNRRAAFLIPMLGDIIADMFTAVSAVMLLTCAMVGPKCVAGGVSLWGMLMCYGFALVILTFTIWISGIVNSFD